MDSVDSAARVSLQAIDPFQQSWSSQWTVLCLAVLAILAMCLYPPWTIVWPCSDDAHTHDTAKGEIHKVTWRYWLWNRPESEPTIEVHLSPYLLVHCLGVIAVAGSILAAIAQRKGRKDRVHGQPEPDKPLC